jgi:hypothetical protein
VVAPEASVASVQMDAAVEAQRAQRAAALEARPSAAQAAGSSLMPRALPSS